MSRRILFGVISSLAIALTGLAATSSAADQDLADHPVVGAWTTSTPSGPAIEAFHADGTFTAAFPVSGVPPSGLTYQSTQIGVWEPTGPRTVHMSAVFLYSDAEGAFTGSFTYDGFQSVSEDGDSIIAEDGGTATVRDADGAVVLELPADHGVVVGTRMRVGAPGYPVGTPSMSPPA